jgi:hypothetical protein
LTRGSLETYYSNGVTSFLRLRPLLGLVLVTLAGPVFGQSAADKATARKLATEGIELHGQGKYAEALDKLQRAEALYDAPVHLVYIARAQAKLGQVVEASETYRRLIRVELAPNAPGAFREAVDAGKREISEVEAQIGSLRVDISPANVPDLKLTIDGQDVSAAVIGVERPANPGRHVVQAAAPGYHSAEATAEVAAGGKQTVQLELTKDPAAVASGPGAATPARGEGTATALDPGELREEDPSAGDPKALHLFVGGRVGAALPGGSLYKTEGGEVAASDYFKTGVAAELSVGAWFLRYFGGKVFVEAAWFAPGPELDSLSEFGGGVKVENSATAQAIGFSALVGTPLHGYGAFGEIGFLVAHKLAVTREFEAEQTACGASFDQTLEFTGVGFRLGAGARIPVSKFFQLTPYVVGSFGRANEAKNDSKCGELVQSASWPRSGTLSDPVANRTILLGVGGDVLFGLQ